MGSLYIFNLLLSKILSDVPTTSMQIQNNMSSSHPWITVHGWLEDSHVLVQISSDKKSFHAIGANDLERCRKYCKAHMIMMIIMMSHADKTTVGLRFQNNELGQ